MVCPSCTAAVVYDPEEPGRTCWHCSRPLPPLPTLRLRGGRTTVLLVPGAMVSSNHLTNDRDYDTVGAQVELHPRAPFGVLRNRTTQTWVVRPEGQDPKTVAPGQAYAIRPGQIEIGAIRGQIIVPMPEDKAPDRAV
jgi:hypothetical protein